jgi:hypothetical protein
MSVEPIAGEAIGTSFLYGEAAPRENVARLAVDLL